MGNLGELSPYEARDTAGFVELMRRLKERSGLTYRELEERAARGGDVLARSTLADTLRRTRLPSPDVLAAFVRACGDEQRVGAWLDVRDRIAAGVTAVPGPRTEVGPETEVSTDSRSHRLKGRVLALALALLVPLIALTGWGLRPGSSGDPGASDTVSRTPAEGRVTIRPARTTGLCLTEGRDRNGAYDSAVAVQLPCARATVPRTYLERVGKGLYRVQWQHPQNGKGCLTVMGNGPVKDMLEPRDNCAQATLFRLEAAGDDSADGFRIRPAHSSRCVGIAGDDTTEGAEAIEERCTGAADQRFLIRTE